MTYCNGCADDQCKFRGAATQIAIYSLVGWNCSRFIPKTNADRIRAKSDEELAAWIADHPVVSEYDENNPQHRAWLNWLRQEAE